MALGSKFGCGFLCRQVLGLALFLAVYITAPAQTLIHNWQTQDGQIKLILNDNILGKSFLYIEDTVRISGKWKENGKTLEITPVAINARRLPVSKDTTTSAIAADTAAVANADSLSAAPPKPKWQIPRALTIQELSNNTLTLSGEGKTYQLVWQEDSSFFNKLINNSILRGIIGILALIVISYLFSMNRRAINWKLVAAGILLQIVFAIGVLKVPFVRTIFEGISGFFVAVLGFTSQGAQFLFGDLVTNTTTFGFIFAFKVLPTVIFFSAFSSALYYLGILQKIVYVFAWVMSKAMKLSGAESLSAAANIFIGQTEAPLLVKPYIARMTRSEILCLMVGGMATIAGGVFAAYVGFLGGDDPAQQLLFATHLLSASIMSAPAAIVASKILLPQTEVIDTELNISKDKIGSNLLDAIANGTTDGLKLAVNVGAMLLVFIALMAMVNSILFDIIGHYTGINSWIMSVSDGKFSGLRLEYIFGFIFAPIAWLMGTPNADVVAVGQLLGEKTIINEFVAYVTMGNMKDLGILTDPKSLIIATYALCGFSNVGSIGIQLGGIGSLAPGQRHVLAHLGLYALLGGTIACLFTAVIAGMIVG